MGKMNLLTVSLPLLTILAIAAPAQANKITSWNYNRATKKLRFLTDEEVTPQIKLIGSPTRVVIDLPGIKLGKKKDTRPASLGYVKAVRAGQFTSQTTRFVMELTSFYGINPKDIKIEAASRRDWSIQLPNPTKNKFLPGANSIAVKTPKVPPSFVRNGTVGGVLKVGDELTWLTQRINAINAQYPVVNASVFVLDLKNGNYADIRGGKAFPAASVIKLPVLIAFLQDLDAGKVSMDEMLVMRPELVAPGSGYMQDSPNWSKFSARYTLTKMIETSDNTATNMIIHRLGGIAYVNQRFQSWGLRNTKIRNWLADLSGTNTVSGHDLNLLLTKVVNGNLLSPLGRKRAIYILKLTKTKSLLVPGIGPGASIAHKTGDIGFAIGDSGVVFVPKGHHYAVTVMLRRPYNDYRGRDYIQQVSKTLYAYFSKLP